MDRHGQCSPRLQLLLLLACNYGELLELKQARACSHLRWHLGLYLACVVCTCHKAPKRSSASRQAAPANQAEHAWWSMQELTNARQQAQVSAAEAQLALAAAERHRATAAERFEALTADVQDERARRCGAGTPCICRSAAAA